MSWYKVAQEADNWKNIINTQAVGTTNNPAGITVSLGDYNKLKGFGSGSGPISVYDLETNSKITVVHGGLDPQGKFAFAKGNGEFVYPENNPNWAQELGPNVNPNDFIVACYEGSAPTGTFKSVVGTQYKGKLNLAIPTQVPSDSNQIKIGIQGE